MSDSILGVVFALIASTSWAAGAVVARVGMKEIGSSTGTLISLIAGFPVIASIALMVDFDAMFKVSSSTILWLALLGFVQFPVGRFLHYNGIRLAGVGPAATAGGSTPLLAAIMAIVFLGEQITYPTALGTVAVVLGLGLVMSKAHTSSLAAEPPSTSPRSWLAKTIKSHGVRVSLVTGILSSLAGATAYALGHNIARHVLTSTTSAPVTASYTLFFGMAILTIISIPKLGELLIAPRSGILMMAASGVLSSLAIFFMYTALSKAPVTVASPVVALYPLIAMTLTHVFFQRLERITAGMVVGAIMVAIGVIFVIVGNPT